MAAPGSGTAPLLSAEETAEPLPSSTVSTTGGICVGSLTSARARYVTPSGGTSAVERLLPQNGRPRISVRTGNG